MDGQDQEVGLTRYKHLEISHPECGNTTARLGPLGDKYSDVIRQIHMIL